MSVKYPKICIANDGKYFIDFILNDRRYRLFNGNKIKLKSTHLKVEGTLSKVFAIL